MKRLANLTLTQDKLNMVRVYTKPRGRVPDYTAPVVLPRTKCTVEEYVSGPIVLFKRFMPRLY